MNKTNILKKNKDLWSLAIFILFITRIFAQDNQSNIGLLIITVIFLGVILFNICVYSLECKGKIKIYRWELIWVVTCILGFLSNLATYEINIIPIIQMVVFLVLFRVPKVIPNILEKIVNTCVAAILISFIYSIIIYDIEKPYSGIYGNPNGTGMVGICGVVCILSIILENIMNSNYKYIKFDLLKLVILEYIIIISDSSTAFIISIIILLLAFIYLIVKKFKDDLLKILIIVLFLVGSVFIINIFMTQSNFFKESKLFYKIESGNFLNGRDIIWSSVLNKASLFGHNSEQKRDISLGGSEHNDFISILNDNGIITLIPYTIFFLIYLIKSISMLKGKYKYQFFVIGTTIMTILLGMTEEFFGLSLILPTILSCLNIGIIMRKNYI